MFESLIEYIAKKLIDLGFKKSQETKEIEDKKDSLTGRECRSIAGIWVCQYEYPAYDEETEIKEMEKETQLVRFHQKDNRVNGKTIFAIAHPEDFEGVVTKDRYFTGLYFNQKNHHSYHGAFQFILSHSHNKMKGRWVGFNREGDEVDSYEWRWKQLDDNPEISKEKEHEYVACAQKVDLFSTNKFL